MLPKEGLATRMREISVKEDQLGDLGKDWRITLNGS
jgi:hypothetical protein